MPDQVAEDVKRERIERLSRSSSASRRERNGERRRRRRGGAGRGPEPHRPVAPARPHAPQHDRELRRLRRRRASSWASGSTARPRRPCGASRPSPPPRSAVHARPRLGRLHQRARPRRPADRGRAHDALRLGHPRRQRRSPHRRRLGGRSPRRASSAIVDLRQRVRGGRRSAARPSIEVVDVPIFDGLDDRDWAAVEALAAGAPTNAESQRLVYLAFLEHCARPFRPPRSRRSPRRPRARSSSTATAARTGPGSSSPCSCGSPAFRSTRSLSTTPSAASAFGPVTSSGSPRPRATEERARHRAHRRHARASPCGPCSRRSTSSTVASSGTSSTAGSRPRRCGRAHPAAMRAESSAEAGVLAIFGPTASGKSAVAEAIARRIPAELVSADSAQLYRGLPILTNQSPARSRRRSGRSTTRRRSASTRQLAHAAIDAALDAGRTPVVVGGTGLYFRAALAELGVPPAPDPGARERWERVYDEQRRRRRRTRCSRRATPRRPRPSTRTTAAGSCGRSSSPRPAIRSRGERLWADDTRRPTTLVGLDVPAEELNAPHRGADAGDVRGRGRGGGAPRPRRPTLVDRRKIMGLREIAELPRDEAEAALVVRTRRFAAYQRKWMRRMPGLVTVRADRSPDEVADEILALARGGQRIPAGRAG